jgi:hypothetical protein
MRECGADERRERATDEITLASDCAHLNSAELVFRSA